MKKIISLLLVMAILEIKIGHTQSPGSLDTTFGTGGIVVSDFGNDGVKSIFALDDGKILAVGSDNANNFVLSRYLNNGDIDVSFGTDGKTTVENIGIVSKAVLTQDKKYILVTGYKSANFIVMRFFQNGSVDSSFGTDGIVITEILNGFKAYSRNIDLQSDGKIIVSGDLMNDSFFYDGRMALIRYLENGNIDSTFATDGKFINTETLYFYKMAGLNITINDKIITTGFSNYGGHVLFGYLENGTIDSSFGINGFQAISFDVPTVSGGIDYSGSCTASGFVNDSTFINAGITSAPFLTYYKMGLAKFKTNGTLDNTFGIEGSYRYDSVDLYYTPNSVVMDEHHKIYTSGKKDFYNTESSKWISCFKIVRFLENSVIDSTFGENGMVSTIIGDTAIAYTSTIQSDGKLLVAGVSDSGGFTIVRYHTADETSSIDPTKTTSKHILVYPNPAKDVLNIKSNYQFQSAEIWDVNGRKYHSSINNNTIDISKLISGTYILSLSTNKGILTEKFVKE